MQGTVITNKGLQLIAKLVASGTALSFTRAAVGIGSVPSGYDPTNMTGLNKYKMNGAIASCGSSGDTASIVFQISSIGVSTGFTITEAGLFATDPDEGEILYCYLDMSSDPQYIYAEGSAISKFVEMTLTVVIGSVQSVTAYINPGSLLTNDGDISNTKVSSFTSATASYPIPAANDTVKVGFGKIKKFFEDIRNAATGACFIGNIVNNCVTNNAKLPLSAAQGKALMDLYTQLNSDLTVKDVTAHFYKNAPVSYVLAYKIGHIVQCIFTISAGSSGWVEVAFCDDDVRPLMDVSVYRARSTIADDNAIQVNGTLKAAENKLYIYISKALSTNLSMSCIYPTTR